MSLAAADLRALVPVLAAALGGDPVDIVSAEPLSAGASRLSWLLVVRAGDDRRRLVVQRERQRGLGRSDVAAEARLLRAARAAGVPVPAVVAADPVGDVLDGAYLVTEMVDGETIPRRIARDPGLAAARAGFAEQCGRILATVHAIPPDSVRPLAQPDVLALIESMMDGVPDRRPCFELGLRWLRGHRPPAREPAVVHGDFRNGNLVVNQDGIQAVLDWELAHIGDPLEDLGWLCARPWRWGGRLTVGGLGERPDLLRAYRDAGGRSVTPAEAFWWQFFATVRWGVMCLEQARTHLSGEMPSIELAVIGRRACEIEYDILRLLESAP